MNKIFLIGAITTPPLLNENSLTFSFNVKRTYPENTEDTFKVKYSLQKGVESSIPFNLKDENTFLLEGQIQIKDQNQNEDLAPVTIYASKLFKITAQTHLNKAIIYGRATKDAEAKAIGEGKLICTFSIATDLFLKGEEKQSVFFDCVTFSKKADFASQYIKKGKPVLVTGKLHQDIFETKTGLKKLKSKIVIDELELK